MISYARARAEAAGWKAAVGLMARTERVVLLSAWSHDGRLPLWSLWILAIGTHITAVTRMFHVLAVGPVRENSAARSSQPPSQATSSHRELPR